MRIGIDASRAFQKQRTSIEEYSYQVIKHLTGELKNHQVVLYIRSGQSAEAANVLGADCPLPSNWKIKIIRWPRLWTQIGLSLELLFHPVDTLFIPSHVVPVIHPKNTIVTVHGLEFEIFPEGYSFWARLYMRWSIKMSCRWAKKIIAVSENTKKDLMRLYKVPEGKIEVVYEGINDNDQLSMINDQSISNFQFSISKPYLLYIGRLEKRKNIEGIIDAYKILIEKYNIAHSLVLAGGRGFGFEIINLKIENLLKISNFKLKIIQTGFITEEEKWQLLKDADVFLFPTFYEGFGLPVLEAQSVGVPVVTSNISSLPELVAKVQPSQQLLRLNLSSEDLSNGDDYSAILCDPKSPESIAEATYKLVSQPELRNDIIKKGYENMLGFSWKKCSDQIASVIKN